MARGRTVEADNGNMVTPREAQWIAALQELARTCPRTLKLVSMDGSLSVVHADDPRFDFEYGHGGERQECILAGIDGIRNDGGGW